MRVALPFDGSPSAIHALDYVIGLAARIDKEPVKVDLINVQEAAVGIPESFARDAADVASKIATACREAGTRLLTGPTNALERASVPKDSAVLIGDPANVIASYVENNRCDAVVMGTRGLGGLAGFVLGSVATKVIHLVKVPVTLVK